MSTSPVKFTDSRPNATFIKLKPLSPEQESRGYYRQLQEGGVIEGILKNVAEVPGYKNIGTKTQFTIEEFTGGTVIIENAGNLKARIEAQNVNVGDALQVTYLGKFPMKSGAFKGTEAHSFKVEVEDTGNN